MIARFVFVSQLGVEHLEDEPLAQRHPLFGQFEHSTCGSVLEPGLGRDHGWIGDGSCPGCRIGTELFACRAISDLHAEPGHALTAIASDQPTVAPDQDGDRLVVILGECACHGILADIERLGEGDELLDPRLARLVQARTQQRRWHEEKRCEPIGLDFHASPPILVLGGQLPQLFRRAQELPIRWRHVSRDQEMAQFVRDREPAPLARSALGDQDGAL